VGVKEIYEFGRIVLDVIVAEALNGNYLFLVVKKHMACLDFYTILYNQQNDFPHDKFNFESDYIISYSLHIYNIL